MTSTMRGGGKQSDQTFTTGNRKDCQKSAREETWVWGLDNPEIASSIQTDSTNR